MNENIDLTKILKDCPKGTKLYSTIHGEVTLITSNDTSEHYPIAVRLNSKKGESFTSEGKLLNKFDGECILFPSKTQRDWSKFTAPWHNKPIEHKFQVGQYITDGYVSGQIIEDDCYCYKILDFMGGTNTIIPFTLQDNYHLWTIKDAKDGDVLALSWLEDKNLFEKIIIFKKYHNEGVKGLYSMPCVEGYGNTFMNGKMLFTDEKVPYYSKTWTCNLQPATKEQRNLLFQKIEEAGYKWNVESKTFEVKFDPMTLNPFDKVLVRDTPDEKWRCELFSYVCTKRAFACGSTFYWFCIPYNDETKHLVGTTEEAPEFYKYWED